MPYTVDSIPSRSVSLNGEEWLYCGGTAYLGLQTHPTFQACYSQNLQRYGTSYGASRQSNLRLQVYDDAEAQLAVMARAPSCLTLSSGFLAAQFIVHQLEADGYRLFHAPASHIATLPSHCNRYSDTDSLSQDIQAHLASNDPRKPAVVFDSVDFQGSDYPAPLWLKALPLTSLTLVVDDSHGFGILGQRGSGAYGLLSKLEPAEYYLCTSLAKSCGLPGGAILGPKPRLRDWATRAAFAGASPMPPAALATFLDAKDLYSQQLERLTRNIDCFRELTKQSKILIQTEGHPVFTFQNEFLADAFEQEKILISRFRYPSVDSPYINRIVLSTLHEESDLKRIASIIRFHH